MVRGMRLRSISLCQVCEALRLAVRRGFPPLTISLRKRASFAFLYFFCRPERSHSDFNPLRLHLEFQLLGHLGIDTHLYWLIHIFCNPVHKYTWWCPVYLTFYLNSSIYLAYTWGWETQETKKQRSHRTPKVSRLQFLTAKKKDINFWRGSWPQSESVVKVKTLQCCCSVRHNKEKSCLFLSLMVPGCIAMQSPSPSSTSCHRV